jgi:hypothetical protein
MHKQLIAGLVLPTILATASPPAYAQETTPPTLTLTDCHSTPPATHHKAKHPTHHRPKVHKAKHPTHHKKRIHYKRPAQEKCWAPESGGTMDLTQLMPVEIPQTDLGIDTTPLIPDTATGQETPATYTTPGDCNCDCPPEWDGALFVGELYTLLPRRFRLVFGLKPRDRACPSPPFPLSSCSR